MFRFIRSGRIPNPGLDLIIVKSTQENQIRLCPVRVYVSRLVRFFSYSSLYKVNPGGYVVSSCCNRGHRGGVCICVLYLLINSRSSFNSTKVTDDVLFLIVDTGRLYLFFSG